jgi:hypothetical protein
MFNLTQYINQLCDPSSTHSDRHIKWNGLYLLNKIYCIMKRSHKHQQFSIKLGFKIKSSIIGTSLWVLHNKLNFSQIFQLRPTVTVQKSSGGSAVKTLQACSRPPVLVLISSSLKDELGGNHCCPTLAPTLAPTHKQRCHRVEEVSCLRQTGQWFRVL